MSEKDTENLQALAAWFAEMMRFNQADVQRLVETDFHELKFGPTSRHYRDLICAVARDAAYKKSKLPMMSAEAQAYHDLESKMALLWKCMIVEDRNTSMQDKTGEALRARDQGFSQIMQERAREAIRETNGFLLPAARPQSCSPA